MSKLSLSLHAHRIGKKTYGLRLYLVSFFSFVISYCSAQFDNLAWKIYVPQDKSFKIVINNDWNLSEKYPGRKVSLTRKNQLDSKITDATFGIFVTQITTPVDVHSFKEIIRNGIYKLKDYIISNLEEQNSNNYPGVYADFTYSRKNILMHKIFWAVMKENQLYNIFYEAPVNMDEKCLDAGQSMVNSFIVAPTQVQLTQLNNANEIANNDKDLAAAKGKTITSDTAGIKLLFNGANSKLTVEDEKQIYSLLKFDVAKQPKMFVDRNDRENEYPFQATVTSIDLNGDGVEEIIVNWGNIFTSGTAGTSVTLFIKTAGQYQENLGFGGDIYEIIPSVHSGFPDISISAPGMKIPIWRYDGTKYAYYNSLDDAEYKKLNAVTIESFKNNSKKILSGNTAGNAKVDDKALANATEKTALKQKPNPNAKSLIHRRWKAVDIIGQLHDNFEKSKSGRSAPELEFGKDGILYLYSNGLLSQTYNYIVAPDGGSILIKDGNQNQKGTIEVIAIASKELRIKFDQMANQDIIVLVPAQ